MSDEFKKSAEGVEEQLMEDVRKGRLRKTQLIEACFQYMTDDQIFRMAIDEGFLSAIPDDEREDRIHYGDLSAGEKIIEKILQRHGGD
jgi:hypothetical protein|tara:strand:+ start:22 stop:285 length:264 start_codon:yes stop_codon:yes gene_type:complete